MPRASVNDVTLMDNWSLRKEDIRLEQKHSDGDTSTMHKASCKGAPCAAKVLPPMDEQAKSEALMQEIAIMCLLQPHPNIVSFIGAYTENMKEPILCFEFVSGMTLEDFLLQDNPCCPYNPPRNTVYWWTRQIFEGLAYLHGLKPTVIHRDLEPDVIMVSANLNTLKIGNFGAAKKLGDDVKQIDSGILGTRKRGYSMYFAPELKEKKGPYTEKVDIFSAALVCWRIATHEQILDRDKWPDANWRPNIEFVEWKSIEDVIGMCWNSDPTARPSAAAVVKKLDMFEDKPYLLNAAPLKGPGVISCTCGPGKSKRRTLCKVCFRADALCACSIQ